MEYGYNFIVNVKVDDIYEDIVKDVETSFNTSNFELDRTFPKRISKN